MQDEVIEGMIERIDCFKQYDEMSQVSKIIAERMLYGKMAIKWHSDCKCVCDYNCHNNNYNKHLRKHYFRLISHQFQFT